MIIGHSTEGAFPPLSWDLAKKQNLTKKVFVFQTGVFHPLTEETYFSLNSFSSKNLEGTDKMITFIETSLTRL